MQSIKQTADRIKNIGISEKPPFEKLEVVMTYKNTTSQYHLFEEVFSSLFALSENVENELNRELNENFTQNNANQSRSLMNKLLNEELDEVNYYHPLILSVSFHHSNPRQKTKISQDQ